MPNRAPAPQPRFGRALPVIFLVISLVFVGLLQWNAMANRQIYTVPMLLMSSLAGLSFAGVVYPPLFFALGKHGKDLPVIMKVIASLCGIAGAVGGVILMSMAE